jgi:hypothetical protein
VFHTGWKGIINNSPSHSSDYKGVGKVRKRRRELRVQRKERNIIEII